MGCGSFGAGRGLVSPGWHPVPSLRCQQQLEGVFLPGWDPEPPRRLGASFKTPGQRVVAGLSWDSARIFIRVNANQVFFPDWKKQLGKGESAVGNGSHPLPRCSARLGPAMPGQVREDGECKPAWGSRTGLGFQGGFPVPLGQRCPGIAELGCFSLDAPKFPRIKGKNHTLTLEAFPTFAFARGTRGCGRCFPAFPRCNEKPWPCSASLTRRFPALCFPRENQSQCWDLLGALGRSGAHPWGSPCRRLRLWIPQKGVGR